MSESKALRSWTDDEAANRALPVDFNAPENAEAKRRFQLMTRDLHSWIDPQLIWDKLKSNSRIQIYWGTATTGRPHLGYFVPMLKLADFLNAGCDVKVLFADLHGFLDNMKSSWEALEHRCAYYTFIIRAMLRSVGVKVDPDGSTPAGVGNLEFVRGSSYQLDKAYTLDVYKMSVLVTTGDTTRAGAEVVKQTANPLMSNLLYPILQALDEEHLGVDIQFGGVDQRKIFMFSRENIHKIGYRKRAYLMNPLIPGLGKSGKMSSSEPLSKVDFDDSADALAAKIRKSFCASPIDFPDDPEAAANAMSNGLLAICKFILFRWIEIKAGAVQFRCKDVTYATFDELQNAFRSGTVYPNELKQAVTPLLEQMLGPIRAMITDESQEGTRLLLRAYPEVGDTRKKEAQLAAARAKGPTTFAAAHVVVGVIVDEPQPQDGAAPGVRRCTVDLGAGERLVVISPLVPATDAKGRRVAVLRNHGAKLYHVVGTETQVRLLYVLAKDGTTKHLITPPADAAPGELIACDGVDGEPVEELARNWSKVAAKLATNADGVPCWDSVPMNVSGVPLLASEHKECAIECDEREKPTKAEKPAAAAAAATSSSAASSSTSTKKGGKAAAPAEEKPLDVSRLQLLVGKIVDVEVHAEADSLYVEKIDLGEASGPRTVVSGLRKHIPIEQMRDRLVIVVANLKPSNLKGIKSFGMVLCGANADRSVIEFVDPPAGSKVGEPIVCDGFVGTPDEVVDVKKANNAWTGVMPDLRCNGAAEGTYKGVVLKTSAGVCKCATLTDCQIS